MNEVCITQKVPQHKDSKGKTKDEADIRITVYDEVRNLEERNMGARRKVPK